MCNRAFWARRAKPIGINVAQRLFRQPGARGVIIDEAKDQGFERRRISDLTQATQWLRVWKGQISQQGRS